MPGAATRAPPVKKDKNFAKFQTHTTGFGLKMLQKMGYDPNKGLGKDLSGRIEPVKATNRNEGMGRIKNPGLNYRGIDAKPDDDPSLIANDTERQEMIRKKQLKAR